MDAPGPRSPAVTVTLPWGVTPLASLRDDAGHGVEELGDLLTLLAAGVPCAKGLVVSLAGEEATARLSTALAQLVETPGCHVVRVRPLVPTRAIAGRFERRPELSFSIADPGRADEIARDAVNALSQPDVTAAVGGSRARLSALLTAAGHGPLGRAASADPVLGDPDQIRVWEAAVTPWVLDRRTTRVLARGEGALDEAGASQVADLADRAQLELGLPVEIGWASWDGRPVIDAVRHIAPVARFAEAPYRIVTLITDDEGCVAPLAIDALDAALRAPDDLATEARVRRVYARPYRRLSEGRASRSGSGPASVARAAARAARVTADVAAPLAAAKTFARGLDARLGEMDAADLSSLSGGALLEALRARIGLVVEALRLLDRGRLASIAVLAAIEATVGSLPRDVLPALANVRPTRVRRRCYDRMLRLVRRIEQDHDGLVPPERLSPTMRKRWEELRASLTTVRSLGIDVRPLPWGHDDSTLIEALRAMPWEEDETRERARRNAIRRVMATARQRPFGRAREAIAASLGVLVVRVARSKGATSEALAAALLRLRTAALEAGARLADAGLVDEPDDALYLSLDEIAQGLAGEPGAYAARVRLRREDDARWARFPAPRRITAA